MDHDWTLSDDDLAGGEWYVWNRETADQRPDIAEAVAAFEAHSRNPDAAKGATEWFRHQAISEGAAVTRALLVGGHVAAYYALASGEIRLTANKKLERMGVYGGMRVGSSHVEWVARDRRAPGGAGQLAIQHAISVAFRISKLQGNRALTMDPFDAETQAMWEAQGFHKSRTELQGGLRRLYVPLFGQEYGKLSAVLREATTDPG